jgi:hypothetical protein
LKPFFILAYDFLVETEKSDGAGSAGKGGGIPILIPSCASCSARYFSYSENDRLLFVLDLFLDCCIVGLSDCSFEDLDVMPVDALPRDPEEAVL